VADFASAFIYLFLKIVLC